MTQYGTQDNELRAMKPPLTYKLLFGTIVACLGSIQYGYHIAELNAPEQFLVCSKIKPNYDYIDCIPMSDSQFGLVTSMFSVGGLIGSLFIGYYSQKYGRRRTSLYISLIALVGSLVMSQSRTFTMILLGRLIVGISCGAGIVITPMYINEIAPMEWKGTLGSMNQLSINLGILLTQALALGWANATQWRNLLYVGALLGLTNWIGWYIVSESPKWLVLNNNVNDAITYLVTLRQCTIDVAKQEIKQWTEGEEETDTTEVTFWQYITSHIYLKPRLAITLLLVGQQFSGINSIIFYGVKIVSQLMSQYAILINFGISITNVVVTFFAGVVIDRSGRKPLLIISTLVMGIMSLIISISILNNLTHWLVIGLFGYIIAFALGLGPIPFLIIGELSSVETISQAQSYGTVCNWIATFAVGYGFPIVNDIIGGYTYIIFSAMTLVLMLCIRQYIPETKGKRNSTEVWQNH
ncbi:hypothetical protein C6P45_000050 [Maudiozyma exigua]|uniref:Major facilitator superfamily (MFS) profile domain-containing protein n=1 Tax=Maudiozyma exigua TaxID=34358 RepID=A0A9P6WH55_MAUEX|nr:hypothetical protein C6P45_000050 [Kazachstania exigua]